MDQDIPYLLLTPGPLTTSPGVRGAMQRDWCTWDSEYNELVTSIRRRLVTLASPEGPDRYTAVLMQGSGTFAVEATIGSVIPPDGKLLVINNGAYGKRMRQIAERLQIPCVQIVMAETCPADVDEVRRCLATDSAVTHVAMVHCETTTGLLNPAAEVGKAAREFGKTYILDAMSSFGGIPFTVEQVGAHYLVTSPNKCLQGVPGFGIVIAERSRLERSQSWARSLSLDLYDQWREMETKPGKWRFTSPTHVVRAFAQALDELEQEGGVTNRHLRYVANQQLLVRGMRQNGFEPLLPSALQSPIITAFREPNDSAYCFERFYQALKSRRFVIYPGKVSEAPTFRIGTIGHVFPDDIARLTDAVAEAVRELGLRRTC